MDNNLKLYNDILFGKLRPFRNQNILQIKFKELTKEIKEEYYNHQPFFEVDFFTPHTEKAKYYRKLIFNESVRYFNHITENINNAIGDDVKTLWIKTTLNNIIADKLSQTNTEIERLNYPISNIDPSANHCLKETNLSEETYIYQYLKVQLIQLYLDIQENFNSYVDDDILNEEEIYLRFFNEAAPIQSFIKEKDSDIEPIEVKPTPQPKPKRIPFKSFRYVKYETKFDNLTDLYDSLKKNQFIAADTDSRIFKKVFSGNTITKPVVWIGNPSEFAYFVKLIYTFNHYIEDLKQRNWEVACKCFIKADGTSFDRSKLRTLKKPQRSHKQLELAVDKLK